MGAQVIADTANMKAEMDERKYFAKPKLGLDAVGGLSAVRLASVLHEVRPNGMVPHLSQEENYPALTGGWSAILPTLSSWGPWGTPRL
eukprot:1186661-Prorocentrum_minimum.AAC.2